MPIQPRNSNLKRIFCNISSVARRRLFRGEQDPSPVPPGRQGVEGAKGLATLCYQRPSSYARYYHTDPGIAGI